MTSLRNRLEKLEALERPGTVIIWRNMDETDDEAIARWRAEHAGHDPAKCGQVHVVGWEGGVAA